ncbi:hypothetical protein [Paenibacillus medicaginis]|uniref:Uncharacterized protein n=1 Tax=Paenibacillus medicaginis TaxID=1470560 RepID=A0ABV5CBQ9_9BACL
MYEKLVIKIRKNHIFILLLLIIIPDILLGVSKHFDYYPVPFFKPPEFYIVFYNVFLLGWLLFTFKEKIVFVLVLPFLILSLIASLIWYGIMEYQYSYIKSPEHTQTLIVKYRVSGLGESSYSSEFYQKSFGGLFMKRLNGQDISFMLNFEAYKPPEDALGLTAYKRKGHPSELCSPDAFLHICIEENYCCSVSSSLFLFFFGTPSSPYSSS